MVKSKEDHNWWCCCNGGLFWGFLLLFLGVWFLAEDLGFVSFDVPFWPIVLIFLGLWFLFKRNKN